MEWEETLSGVAPMPHGSGAPKPMPLSPPHPPSPVRGRGRVGKGGRAGGGRVGEDPLAEQMRRDGADMVMDEEQGAAYKGEEESPFCIYSPSPEIAAIPGVQRHPEEVTEAASLSTITPPPLSYRLRIPDDVISSGRLTDVQLDAVVRACAQHERFLPGGSSARRGFLMGDGPGVGKGRQIAGIILENAMRGRRKAVWVSTSADLWVDAQRDLTDSSTCGSAPLTVFDLRSYNPHARLSTLPALEAGVLFVSYALLVREAAEGTTSRLEQVMEWCGGASFSGVIALDEVHRANSFKLTSDGAVGDAGDGVRGSKSANAVTTLQARLPSARVVYVSATGASESAHLLFAARLGLWGPGTAFPGREAFAREVKAGGTAAMEMLAVQMKQGGMYLARNLSFRGATLQVVSVPLSDSLRIQYDAAAE
ncbi:P-loop containing NTP hydrolase pore-1-domain-containing protein, partial [Baffinella frigidus]